MKDLWLITLLQSSTTTTWSISGEKGFEETNVDAGGNPTSDDSSRTHLRQPYPLLKLPLATECEEGVEKSTKDSLACIKSWIQRGIGTPCEHSGHVKRKFGIEADCFDDKENKRRKKDASPTKPTTTKILPPKLEEFIPNKFLPDILLVHDVENCAFGLQGCPNALRYKLHEQQCRHDSSEIIRYKRVLTVGKALARDTSDSAPPGKILTASLFLSGASLCGTGKHSSAYRAAFTLPAPLATNQRSPNGEVAVIAKIAFPVVKDRLMLQCEARILATVSEELDELQQETCGCSDKLQLSCPTPNHPSVPKYYGYFIPEETSVSLDGTTCNDPEKSVFKGVNKIPPLGRSPILLMEDCGEPILAGPGDLGRKARHEIPPLFSRLHAAGILQNSPYERNILVQPGHLTLAPANRSLATPSFRIIDFGRGRMLQDKVEEAGGDREAEENARAKFAIQCESEFETLFEELKHHFYLGCRES